MQIDRSDIEAALSQKGFKRKDGSHRYFHHAIEGKVTGIVTFTSHGSGYKTYGDALLQRMKKQLKMGTVAELASFVACDITGEEYNDCSCSAATFLIGETRRAVDHLEAGAGGVSRRVGTDTLQWTFPDALDANEPSCC